MNKRSLYILLLVSFFLGCFFQYSRLDGFLHLGALSNRLLGQHAAYDKPFDGDMPQEKFLILYDPTDVLSMYTRHNVEKLLTEKRKAYESHLMDENVPLDDSYTGVALTTGHLQRVAMLPAVMDYVRGGGTLLAMQKIWQEDKDAIDASLLADIGIADVGPAADAPGIYVVTNFLVGAKGFSFNGGDSYTTQVNRTTLTPDAEVQIATAEGVPLVWKKSLGDGHVYMYNGVERDDKTNLGVYMAMLAHCGTDPIYPVVGVKIFILDDFPAPVPDGDFPHIYNELGVDTATFYRKIWWPFVRKLAKDENLRLSGAIIENYNAQIKGPFHALGGRAARDALIIYGRELIDMGGELGLHGYNHQPLAPAGYGQAKLDYVPWESQADMIDSLTELRRYIKSVYPDYDFRYYVPPSNISSPEGIAAVRQVFPELVAVCSLYDGLATDHAWYQDFNYKDGIYNIPRISSGHEDDEAQFWGEITALNHIGVFSHFIHPDELFYAESANQSWHSMSTGLKSFMHRLSTRYPWLTPETVSDSIPIFSDYYDMDYRVVHEENGLKLYSWGYSGELRFLLRTEKEIDHTDGCKTEAVEGGVYIVRVTKPEAHIYWKEEP